MLDMLETVVIAFTVNILVKNFANTALDVCISGPGTGSGAASWNSWNMPQSSGSTGPSGKYIILQNLNVVNN